MKPTKFSKYHCHLLIEMQVSLEEQNWSWEQGSSERHEVDAWQIGGSPLACSLHVVEPVTEEQSDIAEQNTEKNLDWKYGAGNLKRHSGDQVKIDISSI